MRLWDSPDVTLFRKPPSVLRTQTLIFSPYLLSPTILCAVSHSLTCDFPPYIQGLAAIRVRIKGTWYSWAFRMPEDLFMASILFDCLCPVSLLCPPKLKSLHMEYWACTVFLPPQCPDLKTEVAVHQVMDSQRAA